MASFKVISQKLYDQFTQHQQNKLHQIKILFKANSQLVEEIERQKEKNNCIQDQLRFNIIKTTGQQLQIKTLQIKVNQLTNCLQLQTQKEKTLYQEKIETTNFLNAVLKQKTILQAQINELAKKILLFQEGLILQNSKIINYQAKVQLLQTQITQMSKNINILSEQKKKFQQDLLEKTSRIQYLQNNENQKINLIEKITHQYEALKQEKIVCEKDIEKFKNSPIIKLQEKLQSKQVWINQLTKIINKLKQKCIELQMINQLQSPYNQIAYPATNSRSFLPSFRVNDNRQALEQTQRLKYINMCRQVLQQFNSKMKKIQQQKKSMEQKYQSIKLKLNEYQYQQFKYNDKLSLYLEKIERYQKLTQKQQSEMQRIILDFDKELSNVIKVKQEQIKQKIEEQANRQKQINLELGNINQIVKNQSIQEMVQKNQSFSNQLLKNLQTTERSNDNLCCEHLTPDQFEFVMLKQQLETAKKELKKCGQSKRKYKQQNKQLKNQCYNYSVEIRRYKELVQELVRELEIKTNQNQLLKTNLGYNSSVGSSNNLGHRSNQYGSSRFANGDQFYQNLSARLSARNQKNPKSGSDKYQYQVSEIDIDFQKKNQTLLNKIIALKNKSTSHNPAGPTQNQSTFAKEGKNSKIGLNQSNYSSIASSQSSTPSSMHSSKNSCKSYGIKYLYKDRQDQEQKQYHKFLFHKNSLR